MSMWNALASAATTSEVQTEHAGLPSGGSLPAISAVVSSLRAMVSAAPAKRTRSPSTRKRKKSQEESHSQKSKEKSTKKNKSERSKRRQKRATKATRKEKKEKNKKEIEERPKPAENEERTVETSTAPSISEVANNKLLAPQAQGSELSEATLALMDSSEPLDGDMWEEVDESVLLQDFLEADSSWPGDDHSLIPSELSDEAGTQELLTSNSLETDSKHVVASVAAPAGSSQAGLHGAPQQKRKAAQKFKPHELDTLKAFFLVDPLPSHSAKKTLADQMGTSTVRISTWFSRRRYNQRLSQRLQQSIQSSAVASKSENDDGDSLTEIELEESELASILGDSACQPLPPPKPARGRKPNPDREREGWHSCASDCGSPSSDEGTEMFQCDACQRWFHLKCQGTAKSEVQPGVLFFCRACERNRAGP